VYVFFRARMLEERYSAGSETLETRLFREDEIPWGEISFETVYRSLRLFFADRKQGRYVFRMENIAPDQRKMPGS
jgi:hypothetical protein